MVLQDRGRFLLVVATPEMKLTRPGLRTKECCHEHADEIFYDLPGLLLIINMPFDEA